MSEHELEDFIVSPSKNMDSIWELFQSATERELIIDKTISELHAFVLCQMDLHPNLRQNGELNSKSSKQMENNRTFYNFYQHKVDILHKCSC